MGRAQHYINSDYKQLALSLPRLAESGHDFRPHSLLVSPHCRGMTLLGHTHLLTYLKERPAKGSVGCLKVGAAAIEMMEEDIHCFLSSCDFHPLATLKHTTEPAGVKVLPMFGEGCRNCVCGGGRGNTVGDL